MKERVIQCWPSRSLRQPFCLFFFLSFFYINHYECVWGFYTRQKSINRYANCHVSHVADVVNKKRMPTAQYNLGSDIVRGITRVANQLYTAAWCVGIDSTKCNGVYNL